MVRGLPFLCVHFMQILLGSFVATTSVALFAEMGSWSIVSMGILALFYRCLLSLAKIFLDPLVNAKFFNQGMNCNCTWKNRIYTLPA